MQPAEMSCAGSEERGRAGVPRRTGCGSAVIRPGGLHSRFLLVLSTPGMSPQRELLARWVIAEDKDGKTSQG